MAFLNPPAHSRHPLWKRGPFNLYHGGKAPFSKGGGRRPGDSPGDSKKTILCLLLCAVLLLPALPLTAFAAREKQCGCGKSPIVLLPGYSGPQLFVDYGMETEEQIWAIQINGGNTKSLLDWLLEIIPKLIADSGGNKEEAIRKGGALMEQLTEKLWMNEDGSSMYDVTALPRGAHDARWDVMLEQGHRAWNNQKPTTESFIGEGSEHTGADHIYFFGSDWRRGVIEIAAQLDAFIQEVKRESGHDKVSLFGISYGGILAATYLTYYGDKGDVDRVVLHSPALDGSILATELLFNEAFAFDVPSMVNLAMAYFQVESSLDKRVKGLDLSLLSEIAVELLRRYLIPMVLRFGSYWDVIPMDQYEAMKARYLDPVANAGIIGQSDRAHYEVMPHISETLLRMQARGVKIANICGYGLPMGSGSDISSDYVIGIGSTSGAALPPAQKERVCDDPGHYHISPDQTLDAACAYLPEHTWFFKGQFHGQAAWDAYAQSLYRKWLFTDELEDIYSDPDYPQFRDSCNPANALEARFSASVCGFLTGSDELLLLKNMSPDHALSVHSVRAEGLDFEVTFFNPILIAPGQTIRLRYATMLPKTRETFTLTVDFTRESAIPSPEERSFSFTILPDAAPDFLRYDAAAGAGAAERTPLRVRPAQTLALLLALGASLALVGGAYGLARRAKAGDNGGVGGKKRK